MNFDDDIRQILYDNSLEYMVSSETIDRELSTIPFAVRNKSNETEKQIVKIWGVKNYSRNTYS